MPVQIVPSRNSFGKHVLAKVGMWTGFPAKTRAIKKLGGVIGSI